MNDISDTSLSNAPMPQSDPANSLTAEQYDAFVEALDILYIKDNLSGRLKFLENWPVAARVLFSEELIGFDHDGASDLERRRVLEDEAEDRRLEILEIAQTLQEKSVEKSALQVEYVESLVKKLGRDLALLLYAPKIVDRFIPPPAAPVVAADVAVEDAAASSSKAVTNDPLQAGQNDVDAIASDLVPDIPKVGAPSASNPIVDVPEPPKNPAPQNPEEATQASIPDPFAESKSQKRQPVVPEIDSNMDAVEPISMEPPPQRPVPEDIQAEAAQQNPEKVPEVAPEPVSEPVSEAAPEEPPQSREPTRPPLPAEPTRPPLPEPEDNQNAFLGRDPYAPPEQPSVPPQAPPSQPAAPQAPASADPVQQDVSRPAVHKALDGAEPIASQKMTFMPAKKPEAQAQEKPSIPVIGGNKDKPPQ